MIQRCKRCLLSPKSHTQPLRGLQWPRWPDSPDGFDGCDGRSDEFYGYTRFRLPNDTSTGQVWDKYGAQFCRSAGWVRFNTLGGARVDIGIIRMCSKPFHNRSTTGCQPSRWTYSMVLGWSIRSGRVMERGYLGDVGKPTRNSRGAQRLFRYSALGMRFMADSRDRWWQLPPWIHEVCGLLYCEDRKALLGAVQCVPSP